jgi:hypothetical protein
VLLVTSKEVVLEANIRRTKYMFCEENLGQSHNISRSNKVKIKR